MKQGELMQQTIESAPLWKWLIVHISVVCLGYILYYVSYGAVVGAFLAGPLAMNIGPMLAELPESIIAEQLVDQASKINWWIVFPAMNFAVFALLGALTGLFGFAKYVGVVPIGLLMMSITMMTSTIHARVAHLHWIVAASLVGQFLAAYLTAFGVKALRKVG